MKKIFLIVLFFVCAKISFSQTVPYPTTQTLGNTPTTLVLGNAIKERSFIYTTFTDTAEANSYSLYLKTYPFATIATTSDSSMWFRYNNMWVKLGGAQGGASGNFWSKTGDLFPVIPSGFGVGTNDATNLPFKTNGSTRLIIPSTGIVRSAGAANKYLTYDTTTNTMYYGDGGGGGGSSAIPADSLTEWAYEFYDSLQSRIQTGLTYPPADYGNFWYEWWGVMRIGTGTGGKYVISIGEGGAHPLLAGYQDATDTSGILTGNVYTGTGSINDFTFDGLSPFLYDRLHHFAVGYDGTTIVWYIDGVPNGFKAGSFTRHTVGGSTETFCIGGSDHNNADMILLKMRGFEDYCPVDLSKYFSPYRFWYSNMANNTLHVDFTTPDRAKENLGNGFLGIKGYAVPQAGSFLSTPFARYVGDSLIDFNAALPKFKQYEFQQPAYTGPSPSVPGGAIAYDDFNRVDFVPAWPGNNPGGLYRTEGGTAGQTLYTVSSGVGGVQMGQAWAYRSGGGDTYITTPVGTSTQDVRVTNTTGLNAISAIARWTDANNFVQIYTSTAGVQSAGKMVAGVYTQFGSTWSAGAFTEIKLIVSGNLCNVWVDGVHRVTDADVSDIPTGTSAGFGINSNYSRVAKFEVY